MRALAFLVSVAAAAVVAGSSLAGHDARWTITDLGTLGGSTGIASLRSTTAARSQAAAATRAASSTPSSGNGASSRTSARSAATALPR